MPTVRVIVPVFNRAGLLAEAIESVLAQDFTDFEVLIADDGSSDNTAEVAERLARRDARVRLLRLPHGGAAAARNAAIRESGTFEFVAFLDSDDLWQPHHLRSAVAALRLEPEAGMVFARVETRDRSGKWTSERLEDREARMRLPLTFSVGHTGDVHRLSEPGFYRALLRGEFSPHPSTAVIRARAEGARTATGDWFDTRFEILEDCDLCRRIAKRSMCLFIDELHAVARYQDDNLTGHVNLSSEITTRRLTTVLDYWRRLLAECTDRTDRAQVRQGMAKTAYVLAQCKEVQGARFDAARCYMLSLQCCLSADAAKGLIGVWLPAPIVTALKRGRSYLAGAE
jgi:glycosyltransferase involved in cell wall biosynthesis